MLYQKNYGHSPYTLIGRLIVGATILLVSYMGIVLFPKATNATTTSSIDIVNQKSFQQVEGMFKWHYKTERNRERVSMIVENPKAYLYAYGASQGLSQNELRQLDRIIQCESGWRSNAQNPTSSASGYSQIIYSTWQANSEYDWSQRYDPKANIETAVTLFLRQGATPWVCK